MAKQKKEDNRDVFEKALDGDWIYEPGDKRQQITASVLGAIAGGTIGRKFSKNFGTRMKTLGPAYGAGAGAVVGAGLAQPESRAAAAKKKRRK